MLAYLMVIFIIVGTLAIALQILLYTDYRDLKNKNIVFILNVLLNLVISYIIYTSVASNHINQKLLAASWGIISLIAFILKLKDNQLATNSRLIITLAMIGGLVHLYL